MKVIFGLVLIAADILKVSSSNRYVSIGQECMKVIFDLVVIAADILKAASSNPYMSLGDQISVLFKPKYCKT